MLKTYRPSLSIKQKGVLFNRRVETGSDLGNSTAHIVVCKAV